MDVTYSDEHNCGCIGWEVVTMYGSKDVISSRITSLTLPLPGVRGWDKIAIHEYGHCAISKNIEEYDAGCNMSLFQYDNDNHYSMALQRAEILAWVTGIRWVRRGLVSDFIRYAVGKLSTYWITITMKTLRALTVQPPSKERIKLTSVCEGSKKVEVSTW